MERQETAEKTLATFKTVFGNIANLNEHTSADDIDKWDSLNHVILIQELEKEFGFKFDLFEIIELRDIGGIIDYIFSKTNE